MTPSPTNTADGFAVPPKEEQDQADQAHVAEDYRRGRKQKAQLPLPDDEKRQNHRWHDEEEKDGDFRRLYFPAGRHEVKCPFCDNRKNEILFRHSGEFVSEVLLCFSEIELVDHEELALVTLLEFADQKRV